MVGLVNGILFFGPEKLFQFLNVPAGFIEVFFLLVPVVAVELIKHLPVVGTEGLSQPVGPVPVIPQAGKGLYSQVERGFEDPGLFD